MTISPVLRAAFAAASLAIAAAPLTATAAAPSSRSCFFVTEWSGWSAPGPDTLYLRVNSRDIYRVDLTPGPHSLRSPGSFLVNKTRGSTSICSPLDLDLAISDGHGFSTPLLPRSLVKLTPEQVAAIPAKWRP